MRLAISMATGTGKTRVMAMLIAWYAVNRGREHRAAADGLARNVGRIVVIAPGRTIARQLQMLVPTHRDNIYIADRLAPDHLLKRLNGISVHVLNFEKLQPRRGLGFAGLEGVTTKATVYQDYERQFRKWERDNVAATGQRSAHPVMIAVVNNRRNAQKLHEIIGGATRDADGDRYDPSIGFELLSNVPHRGATRTECEQAPARTIVVYSPGGGDAARAEGSLFTNGRIGVREAKNGEEVEEILASVARPGTQGAEVRCVISVGMLTEGWDCPFVTSILGFRKFGSELLARQTMGRALRRWDYDTVLRSLRGDTGLLTSRFPAQYTTVIGVPFGEHLHTDDQVEDGTFRPPSTVRPVSERRTTHRILVPRFTDYVLEYQEPRIRFIPERVRPVRRDLLPGSSDPAATTFRAPIGEQLHVTEQPLDHALTGVWKLAAQAASSIGRGRQKDGDAHHLEHGSDLFSQCLRIVRQWLRHEQVDIDESHLRSAANRERLLDALLAAIDASGPTGLQRIGSPLDLNRVHDSAGDWRPFETRLEHIIDLGGHPNPAIGGRLKTGHFR